MKLNSNMVNEKSPVSGGTLVATTISIRQASRMNAMLVANKMPLCIMRELPTVFLVGDSASRERHRETFFTSITSLRDTILKLLNQIKY